MSGRKAPQLPVWGSQLPIQCPYIGDHVRLPLGSVGFIRDLAQVEALEKLKTGYDRV